MLAGHNRSVWLRRSLFPASPLVTSPPPGVFSRGTAAVDPARCWAAPRVRGSDLEFKVAASGLGVYPRYEASNPHGHLSCLALSA